MERGLVRLDALGRRQCLANVNIPVAGGGLRWLDANGDDGLPTAGQVKCVRQNLLELLFVWDDVVGREHGHDAGGRTSSHQRGAKSHGRASVAANRLGNDIFLRQLRQLSAHLGRLHLVGNDQDILDRHQRQHAVNRLL